MSVLGRALSRVLGRASTLIRSSAKEAEGHCNGRERSMWMLPDLPDGPVGARL
jgi:hypothetical protein